MVVVMLPAYNESDSIGPLLERIAPVLNGLSDRGSVLLVDDGSSSTTEAHHNYLSFFIPLFDVLFCH